MKQKIALMAPAMFNWSETQRMIKIAIALKERNYHIIFLGNGHYSTLINKTTFHCIQLNEDEQWFTKERIQKMLDIDRYGNNYASSLEIETIVNAEVQLLNRIHPDVIVTGYRTSITISAKIAKIPLVWCLSAVVTPMYFNSGLASFPDNKNMHVFLEKFHSEETKQKYIQKFLKLSAENNCSTSKEWNTVLKKYNMPLLKSDLDIFKGDLNLMSDAPELFPDSFKFENQYKFCGPIFSKSTIPLPECVSKVCSNSKKSILVVLGSSGHYDVFMKILHLLCNVDANIFVAKTNILSQADEQNFPKNFHFCDSFPLVETLNYMDLCIMHGGQGTMYEDILSATPFIGIPMFNEQQYNLENLCRYGVGEIIHQKELNHAALTKAINDIFSNRKYYDNMNELKEKLNKYYSDSNFDAAILSANYINELLSKE